MQNNKTHFVYVLYSDKTWVFDQSECVQGPIYIIKKIKSVWTLLFTFTFFRANEEFNNAVVLTSRHLDANELLEVRVDRHLTKWAGSLEIGVTTHDPETLEFPSTMTNVQPPGTWMMSGGSVVCDGVTSIEEYGPTLDEIKVKQA